jgi:hypothetical protein
VLGDQAVAVGADGGDGVAQARQAGHVLQPGVGVIAAGDLGAAFEQVAGHRGARQALPVVGRPAEMRQRGADGQRRVGHAAGHHDLRAGAQRVGNGLRAQVGVGADDRAPGQRAARLRQQGRTVVRAGHVVAVDHRDARPRQAQFTRQCVDAPGRAVRVGGAEVADDADAVLQAGAQHRRQHRVQQGLVAGLGVLPARQLRQRQRAFGQRLEDQHRGPLCGGQRRHHGRRGVGAVAGKAGGAADQQGVGGDARQVHAAHSRPGPHAREFQRYDRFICIPDQSTRWR